MSRPLLAFGTRPEAIKVAPVIHALQKAGADPIVCVTGQHREMLDQVLQLFDIKPHVDLAVMRERQDLYGLTARVLEGMKGILEEHRPSVVLVQGDTTTAFVAALAAFYARIPVAHVEAGLRTGRRDSPFPEEANRILAGVLADHHFAPTATARANLLREGHAPESIWVTGNTVIDALHYVSARYGDLPQPAGVEPAVAAQLADLYRGDHRIVLVTGHRRESFGQGFEEIAHGLRAILDAHPDVRIVYPVHLNPQVREPVERILGHADRAHLMGPVPYGAFVWLMKRAHLILTDSGGVQEEAPSLGKPVLVMRDTTERPEAVAAGTARLVGADRARILKEASLLLNDASEYQRMAMIQNPFGDGTAAEQIVGVLRKEGLA